MFGVFFFLSIYCLWDMKLCFSLLLHVLYIFVFIETIHRLPEKFHDSETEGWRVFGMILGI